MAFQVVVTTEEGMTSIYPDGIEAFAEDHFAEITGTHSNPRTRAELQGHPTMRGYIGPCWGGETETGDPIIRYEDAQDYADLST
ncbi:hypothetical protein EDD52_12345 [Primorskyibacter sedentarius]|uniref:Uncharacterized protein n=1 Tax=Primorskyibacter sedentarius TaxID=745311 RepID=A0A4R3J134_9RHOB|nr:hypothetical protein [Primorskyibacter sedentarius]TCS59015.1 hypothetical protein EDD52_12345 [Primorskyibacter sedentarius]